MKKLIVLAICTAVIMNYVPKVSVFAQEPINDSPTTITETYNQETPQTKGIVITTIGIWIMTYYPTMQIALTNWVNLYGTKLTLGQMIATLTKMIEEGSFNVDMG